MKVLIPLAGLGSRMQPITHTRAKPLIHVAGKEVLAHLLDPVVKSNKVSEAIFIIGHLGDQVKDWVESHYEMTSAFITQSELSGQAPAIKLAESELDEDVLIWFSDTLTKIDLDQDCDTEHDGIIYVKEHEDPKRFGVVAMDEKNIVTSIEEKPDEPKSNLVNIGLYYVKNYKLLIESIDELIARDMKTKGEYYLMDAFNIMLEKGAKFEARVVEHWWDTGKPETTLHTNRELLKLAHANNPKIDGCTIIEPVFIEEGAIIKNSTIGPDVSVGKGSLIEDSQITDSIISEHTTVKTAKLDQCIIGNHGKIQGEHKNITVAEKGEHGY